MQKCFRKTLVAGAVVGALAAGLSGSASAYEYALSHLLVTGFAFSGSAATVESYTFNLTNTAILNGTPVITSASCSGTSTTTTCAAFPANTLDAPVAEIPAGTRSGENNFTFVGPTGTYASSDSVIYTAQLVDGVPSSSEQIAEVDVAGNGTALGNAELQSNTTVTFSVNVTSTFDLNFFADPDLRAAINDPPGGTHNAQANLTSSFTFVSNSVDANGDPLITISWSPQGTAANDCVVTGTGSAGVTCVETFDTQDLNRNLGTGTNPSDLTYSFDQANLLTQFGIHVAGLPQDTYSLALNTVTSGNVNSVQGVPEPVSLALVGIGLLGMGLGLRRRSNNA
jgi:hypothetical protein